MALEGFFHQTWQIPASFFLTLPASQDGMGEQPLHLDMDYVRIASGDRFLICSDGLYREIPEPTIHRILETEDIHDCNQALRAAALAAGGGDNITSVLVDFH